MDITSTAASSDRTLYLWHFDKYASASDMHSVFTVGVGWLAANIPQGLGSDKSSRGYFGSANDSWIPLGMGKGHGAGAHVHH